MDGAAELFSAVDAALNDREIAAYEDFTDAVREVLALARQAEAAERAIDDLSHLSVEGFLDWQRDFRRARALLGGSENAE